MLGGGGWGGGRGYIIYSMRFKVFPPYATVCFSANDDEYGNYFNQILHGDRGKQIQHKTLLY